MPQVDVKQSIHIQAPIDKIFEILNNFNQWTAWSPWLIMEPEADVQVAGDNKSYQWKGKRVGEGNMQVLNEHPMAQIDYALNFLKPFKSKAKVGFLLYENEQGVEVTWTMQTKLPFFLFWMKKSMMAYIRMDYTRGLTMLKDLIETGTIPSKLEFKGKNTVPEQKFLYIKNTCATDSIAKSMTADFTQLMQATAPFSDTINGPAFSIYHDWDLVKGLAEYSACIPVADYPETLPDNIKQDVRVKTQVYTLRHIGAYKHLGNGWSTMYNMIQNKEIKANKALPPFEVYMNDPATTKESDLITDIHFPIK